MTAKEKLSALRNVMAEEGVDGFIVPRADEYQGEYIPASSDRLRWMTGFTGSAGHAVILMDRAAVFSDGRYTIQLRREVDPALFDTGDSTKVTIADWLSSVSAMDKVIGYDPRLHTPSALKALLDKGVVLRPLSINPVDAIWRERPPAPSALVEAFPLTFAGQSAAEKLDIVSSILKARKCDTAVITLPDSIAWLLNIRGTDVPHIPIALSTAIVKSDGTIDWFIDKDRVPRDVMAGFSNRAALLPPQEFGLALERLSGQRVIADGKRSSAFVIDILKASAVDLVDAKDPIIPLKARKNEAEQQAMRNAHVRDGVALVRFLRRFSEEIGKRVLTEIDAEQMLETIREGSPEFKENSFDTIASYGANGAVIHYRATPETDMALSGNGLFLLDSGAQYIDGTTDVTRTLAIGQPTQEMRERYTLVLKAHIAVASARFPVGTSGAQIDALARSPLWKHGLDYAHGTGHGVGVYLSVHEEAASISPRGTDPIEAGMILSNEPGYYKEGDYGIRLENLVLAYEDGVCEATGKTMLAFESLTLAPFDPALIVPDMLDRGEMAWLEAYHAKVFDGLSPYLDPEDREWLAGATNLNAF